MNDKYRNTAAEVFKLRMQFKAQMNDLRKTYHEIVIQKPIPERKHYMSKFIASTTNLLPQPQRSIHKQTAQRRHYSPFAITQGIEYSNCSGKKQYNTKSIDNLGKILKQNCQAKKKSLSYVVASHNKSMINLKVEQKSQKSFDGLKIGLNDKSLNKIERPSKKIIPKYHKFDNFLG